MAEEVTAARVPAVKLNEGRGDMTVAWIKAQLHDFLDGDNLKAKYTFDKHTDIRSHPVKDLYQYLNSFNDNDDTPLQTAVEDNNTEVVRFLLNIGPNDTSELIDVNHRRSDREFTALHSAVRNQNVEIVKMLIKEADPSDGIRRSDKVFSPIFTACEFGNIEIVKILLNSLKRLTDKPFLECINTPLSPGAHTTPLFIATIGGHEEVVQLLLENRATLGGAKITRDQLDDILAQSRNINVVKTLVNKLKLVTDTFEMERIPGGLSKDGGEGYSPLFSRLIDDVNDKNTEIIEFLIRHDFRLKPFEATDEQMARIKDSYKHYGEQVRPLRSRSRGVTRSRSRSRNRNRGRTHNRRNGSRNNRIVAQPHRWELPRSGSAARGRLGATRGRASVTRGRASVTRRRARVPLNIMHTPAL